MDEFDSRAFAVELSKYLSSRFHPELPHIGTIGTADQGFTDSEYGDEDSETEEPESNEKATRFGAKLKPVQDRFSSFKFVPFSASYKLNLVNQLGDLFTRFSFYIRTSEGSWHDLQGKENPGYQASNPDNERDAEFWLTKEDLKKSFKHFDVRLKSNFKDKIHYIELFIDGVKLNQEEKNKFKVSFMENGKTFSVKIDLYDKSEPFVIREGKKYDLVQQQYHAVFEKSVQINDDGTITVDVIITNKSPFTKVSDIPQIELKSQNVYETKAEATDRYKDQVFNNSNQEKELYSLWTPKIFKKKNSSWNASGSLYGHLMEFSMTEDGINSSNDPYERESDVEHVINLVYDEDLKKNTDGRYVGKITYQNYIVFDEQIPPMEKGEGITEAANKIGMSPELAKILAKRFPQLYKFQYDTINAINSSFKKDDDSGVLISSRTGGGKTEAFLFPILDYCLSNLEMPGTKAIIFYPTKALSNDQTSRIVSLLYEINMHLKSSGASRKITVGLCHADMPKSEKDPNWQMYWQGVPLRCPACERGFLTALDHTHVRCLECKEELDFVILFQDPNFGILPDIFVTNPDKIQWDMIERPDNHGIFGREITSCRTCHHGYARLMKKKCDSCGGQQFQPKKPMPPRFIVFDEIHQFKGTFGANSLYLHERLRTMFKRYAKTVHQVAWPVCSIGSSATIAKADIFAKEFFGLDQKKITIVPPDDDTRKSYYGKAEYVKRTHLFVMPYKYRPGATCGKIVGFLEARRIDGIKSEPFSQPLDETGEPLQMLGFVNSIQDIGQLVNISRREREYSVPIFIDGHSTDYDHNQRADVEKRFNRKELNVIFATPTLEVGVDFETVNVVLIYGFPFSFNDYVQRIGRGGRGENTLVVTICHNFKPIDHFYYVDAKKKIAEQHTFIEPIPVTRDNPEIINRHLVASILDKISSLRDSPDLWENIKDKLLEEFETRGKDMYDRTKEFSPINSLGLPESEIFESEIFLKNVIKEEITRLKAQVQNITKSDYLHRGSKSLDNRYKITNLRDTENSVQVEMIWEVFED